jgi:hypothetical protein
MRHCTTSRPVAAKAWFRSKTKPRPANAPVIGLRTMGQAAVAKGQQGLGGRELMEPTLESEAAEKLSALLRRVMPLPQFD